MISVFGEPFSWRWFQLPEQVSRDYFASCATSLEDSHAVMFKLRNNPPPPPPPESRQVVTVEERHALALDGDFDDDHEARWQRRLPSCQEETVTNC